MLEGTEQTRIILNGTFRASERQLPSGKSKELYSLKAAWRLFLHTR
jgi:hypothetical protein